MNSKDYALIAAAAADSKKGTDILIQHVSELVVVTDYFVIVTAANDRQVEAIADIVEEKLREQAGIKPIGREGFEDRKWVLLDFGTLVVHIFQQETRDYYRLETIWNDAPLVDVAEAGIDHPEYSERIAKLVAGVLSGEADETEEYVGEEYEDISADDEASLAELDAEFADVDLESIPVEELEGLSEEDLAALEAAAEDVDDGGEAEDDIETED